MQDSGSDGTNGPLPGAYVGLYAALSMMPAEAQMFGGCETMHAMPLPASVHICNAFVC